MEYLIKVIIYCLKQHYNKFIKDNSLWNAKTYDTAIDYIILLPKGEKVRQDLCLVITERTFNLYGDYYLAYRILPVN